MILDWKRGGKKEKKIPAFSYPSNMLIFNEVIQMMKVFSIPQFNTSKLIKIMCFYTAEPELILKQNKSQFCCKACTWNRIQCYHLQQLRWSKNNAFLNSMHKFKMQNFYLFKIWASMKKQPLILLLQIKENVIVTRQTNFGMFYIKRCTLKRITDI